jgi:hypothetical protein
MISLFQLLHEKNYVDETGFFGCTNDISDVSSWFCCRVIIMLVHETCYYVAELFWSRRSLLRLCPNEPSLHW